MESASLAVRLNIIESILMTEKPTRIRWFILALLFSVNVILYIDRLSISIAAKYIMPEYGLSKVQMGWIFSAFVIGYALFQIPGGWLGDRFGPRRVLAGAIILWSLFTLLTAMAGDWFLTSLLGVVGSFMVVRMLMGVGEAAGPPNHNRVVANWFPLEERAFAASAYNGATAFGAFVSPPLIAWIALTLDWRIVFYLFGAIGILVALIWYWLSADRPEEHPWVNVAEMRLINPESASSAIHERSISTPTPWKKILCSADLWYLSAAGCVAGYNIYIFLSWFYIYLVEVRGFSLLSGGVYTTAPFLAGAVAAPLGGWLSDRLSLRFGRRIGRSWFGSACVLSSAIFIMVGAAATNPHLAVLCLALGAGAGFMIAGAYFAITIDLAKEYAGVAGGLVNMCTHIGAAISPVLTPVIAQHFGWTGVFYMAAALALLASFLWLGIHPERSLDLGQKISTPLPEVLPDHELAPKIATEVPKPQS